MKTRKENSISIDIAWRDLWIRNCDGAITNKQEEIRIYSVIVDNVYLWSSRKIIESKQFRSRLSEDFWVSTFCCWFSKNFLKRSSLILIHLCVCVCVCVRVCVWVSTRMWVVIYVRDICIIQVWMLFHSLFFLRPKILFLCSVYEHRI